MITDSSAEVQIKEIRKLGIMKYIDYLVTSEEACTDKPNPESGVIALKNCIFRRMRW